ncbi:Yip1 family protein [Desulfovibrio inopinatus]|uniref:Yip1 family protein n=1 Tax=Desulfovibrio inopinatus TaxID=102109 RepID=UPI00041918A1|nr:Yip1 family protein [Desulfovibrio inopinatus]
MSTMNIQSAMSTPMTDSGLPGHYSALVNVLKKPHVFFADFPEQPGYSRPLTFLLFSAMFYTAVSVMYFLGNSIPLAIAVFVNALVMPFILAAVSWALLTMTTGRYAFERIFSMYAYASGALMLFSWIPMVGFICELWKAGLMVCALAKGLKTGWGRSLVIVVATFIIIMLLIWSILPVVAELRVLIRPNIAG